MNLIKNITEKYSGYKTYVVAIATLLFAVTGVLLGKLEFKDAVELVLGALGLASLRHSIK